jgi:predicted PurR-regulated permease PerM
MMDNNKLKSPPWQPGTRLAAGVVLLIFISWLLYSTRQLAVPLILALFLAYLLHPLVSKLVDWSRMPRWLAVLIAYLLLIIIMMGATTGIGLAISQQLTGLVEDLITLSNQLPAKLEELQTQVIQLGPWMIDLNRINLTPIIEQLSSTLQPVLMGTGTIVATVAGTAVSTVWVLILVLVIGFYLLLDFDKLKGSFLGLVPEDHVEDIESLTEDTGKVWHAFVRGQLVLGVVVGSVVGIALSIVGLRFALGLALIAGILEFVPIFGPIISGIIAALVAFFQGGNWLDLTPLAYTILILIIFTVIQQIENNILVPRIIGHHLNLHPLIVLLAALSGGIVAGVLGILLAAPVVATCRVWLGYIYRKIVGLGTEPEPILIPPTRRQASPFLIRIRTWLNNPRLGKKADNE